MAKTQGSHKGVLIISTLSLLITLSACGQKGQLYPAPAEKPVIVEPQSPVNTDVAPSDQPQL